jgi:hypothetical protein
MQQIADWLQKLGMSEYARRFAENDIDVKLLSELTDSDFDRLAPRRSEGRCGLPLLAGARTWCFET